MPIAAVSSASIPTVFPPRLWNGVLYMDGGTIYNVNIQAAINQCLKQTGGDQTKIIIDTMICGDYALPDPEEESGYSWQNYLRSWSLGSYYSNVDDISKNMKAYPDINYRYTVSQVGSVTGTGEINFENENTWPLQEKGRQQASDALAGKPGANLTEALRNWNADPTLKGSFPTARDYLNHYRTAKESEAVNKLFLQ